MEKHEKGKEKQNEDKNKNDKKENQETMKNKRKKHNKWWETKEEWIRVPLANRRVIYCFVFRQLFKKKGCSFCTRIFVPN